MSSNRADRTESQSTGSQPNTQNKVDLAPAVPSNQDRFTAERIDPLKRKRIIKLLAEGMPIYRIAKHARCSEHTVRAVQIRNSEPITQLKERLAFLCLDTSLDSFTLASSRMKRMSDRNLIMLAGVAADKVQPLTQSGPEIAVAIQVNSQDSVKLSAALKQFMPPEIDS